MKKFSKLDFPGLGEDISEIDYEQELQDLHAFKQSHEKEYHHFENLTEI